MCGALLFNIIIVVIFVILKVRRQTGQPQIPHPLSGQTHTPACSIVDAGASLAVTCRYKIARFFGILQCYKIFFLISLKKRRSQGHQMKIEYESIALAKAEAKGPKEVANYRKKLAKDLKLAMKGAKT